MNVVKQVIERDRFAIETVGIELIEVTPGNAKARLPIRDVHLNGLGTVQGGAIFTLADLALAAACNSYGTIAVLINGNMSYFKSVSQGTLFAEAVEESINPKLATYLVRVTNETNELIDLLQATVYRKKESLASLLEPQ
jgi:acyl-CoA thioesterase